MIDIVGGRCNAGWFFQELIRVSGCVACDTGTGSDRACPTTWQSVFPFSRRSLRPPRAPSTPSRRPASLRRRTTPFSESEICGSKSRVVGSFYWRERHHSTEIPCPRRLDLIDEWCSTSTGNQVYAKPSSRYALEYRQWRSEEGERGGNQEGRQKWGY